MSSKTIFEAIDSSGEWIAPDQLREAALTVLQQNCDVQVPLDSVDHLDATALQILLAFSIDLKKQGHTLDLSGATPQLQKWFEFAGATDLLPSPDANVSKEASQ